MGHLTPFSSIHGGLGYYISMFSIALQAAVALCMARVFGASRQHVEFLIGSGLVLLEYVCRTVVSFIVAPKLRHEVPFFITLLIISISTIILAIYLIEYLKQNYYLRAELFQTEKLKVVSEVAASIAHEVRNPMTAVRGFAQLLAEDPSINDNHSVALYVLGTSSTFDQALMNVIKNAIESMPHGGTVFIRARWSRNSVELEIADEGHGMTESELSRLGTPFYSTKSNGTGLGLTSAYQGVQLMNGKIQVKSKRNEGTTFNKRGSSVESFLFLLSLRSYS